MSARYVRVADRCTVSQPDALDRARAYIEAHFDEPLTLAQLAALSALSVSRFATVFRQRFGLSPYRYLCRLRIQRAQTLLLAGIPGATVATAVGFFDQSHFGRHFKQCCGMTPSMFVERAAGAPAEPSASHCMAVRRTGRSASLTVSRN